jgi:hypothetical protein
VYVQLLCKKTPVAVSEMFSFALERKIIISDTIVLALLEAVDASRATTILGNGKLQQQYALIFAEFVRQNGSLNISPYCLLKDQRPPHALALELIQHPSLDKRDAFEFACDWHEWSLACRFVTAEVLSGLLDYVPPYVLLAAIISDKSKTVEVLLQYVADPSFRNDEALVQAVNLGSVQIVQLLLKNRRVNVRSRNDVCIQKALEREDQNMILLLLEAASKLDEEEDKERGASV